VCVTCSSQNLKGYQVRESTTISPDETTIRNQRKQLSHTILLSVKGVRVLEDVVDSLGIRNPQAFLLREIWSTPHWSVGSPVNAYPKWTIPTSRGSIVLQDVLFGDTGITVLPIPFVSFKVAMSETNKGTRRSPTNHRRPRRGLVVLEYL
jgi:hypothetical protein